MGLLREKKTKDDDHAAMRSMKFNKEKIDRAGHVWKKPDVWVRKDYLSKIKVIAHFQSVSSQDIINKALAEFVAREYDKSQVLRQTVAQAGTPKKVTV